MGFMAEKSRETNQTIPVHLKWIIFLEL
jgi:hypothetical protein